MRIEGIRTYTIGNPWKNWVLVKIETDEGVVGWGDATSSLTTQPAVAAVNEIARLCWGRDPLEPRRIWSEMFLALYLPSNGTILAAMAGIETACWDILGKVLGCPLYRLFGGRVNDRVKAYANGWYNGPRDRTYLAERAAQVTAQGYCALKFDPFGPAFGTLSPGERRISLDLVRAVRDAIGPNVELLIEAHDRFTPREAISIARDLDQMDVLWLEAPVWATDVKALTAVAAATQVRVVAGERFTTLREFADFLATGLFDVIQPEYVELGGIGRLLQAAGIAEAYQAMLAPHNARCPLSTSVNVQVQLACRNAFIQETFDDFHVPWMRDIFDGLPSVRDGYFHAEDRPGLGVTVNEAAIADHPYSPHYFMNLFESGWEQRFEAPPVKKA